MYLKRLEICGFKSFADKTRLEFEPGIIAIIGPNGCGKSNISDSIRWCLGEQSARSLRSHQMMDVIFAGSQSRQTLGMAEVSLTFDNSQNVLPIDYTEVTATRRLFRSGESEYFINKTQCRLKDIRDLFLDTGIGAEGYSIMEQGKVEFVLSAKPEERRELFEEAAGVSKFKVRREETLRKLEKVEIDMNRVNDMLALLKEQIHSLDLAARKARQYQKHQQDLKRLEIASLVHKVITAKKEIERIGAEFEPKQQQLIQLTTQSDQIEAEVSQIRLDQVEKDERYVKLQDEYSQIKSGINVADERIQQASQREVELNERCNQLADEIKADTERLAQYNAECGQIKELVQNLAGQVSRLEEEYKAKEAQVQDIRLRIIALQQEENSCKERLFTLASEKTNLHNETNRLTSDQTRCQTQILALQKELNRIQTQRSPLLEQLTAREQEIAGLAARMQELKLRQESLKASIADLLVKQTDARARQAALKERIVSLESKRQTLQEWEQKDPQRAAIHAVQSLGLPGLRGPLGSLIRIAAGSEDIVGSALGDKLQYMVCDTVETAQRAVQYLEDNGLGRVTFIVLDRLPENSPTPAVAQPQGSRSLLSLITFDPDLEKAARFLCGEMLINGRSIYGHALIQGGGQMTFDKHVLIDEDLRGIAQELESSAQSVTAAAAQEQELQSALDKVQEEKSAVDLEHQRLAVQSEWLENQLKTQRDELQYLDREMSLNQTDIQTQEQEEHRIVEQLAVTGRSLGDLEAEEQKLSERQIQIAQEIQQQRDGENTLAPVLTEAKVIWATQANELSSRQREDEKLRETIASLAQRLEQSRQELNSNETKIAEQKITQQQESDKLKSLSAEQEAKEREIQVSLAERQQLLSQLDKHTLSLQTLRQQIEELEQETHNLQMENRSFELQNQTMEQRLTEDHGLAFTDVKDEYAVVEVDEEEIQRLKRKLESMGPVNLAAPEEYANIEERYNFLLTQQQDLIKAKDDLHQVITKINENTRENFKKTFDQVRENFRTIYHQLFEGGEADLLLTDETNLLESGVDIAAQPPGKKLQNIALLSGGEKALTAIALLFAFFMVKPSPFCILDEVDAPLDEANVGRYINMVKSFSDKTQFLVVTHNKRTMEMANILYGVTMEELGVSKIISVRLSKEDLAATA